MCALTQSKDMRPGKIEPDDQVKGTVLEEEITIGPDEEERELPREAFQEATEEEEQEEKD